MRGGWGGSKCKAKERGCLSLPSFTLLPAHPRLRSNLYLQRGHPKQGGNGVVPLDITEGSLSRPRTTCRCTRSARLSTKGGATNFHVPPELKLAIEIDLLKFRQVP